VDRYSFIAVDLHHLLLAGFTGALGSSVSARPNIPRAEVAVLGRAETLDPTYIRPCPV
jgi:hypothetical protein